MTKLYWLPVAALLVSGCNFDLPTGTLTHDGSGELVFTRTMIASATAAIQSNPGSCVSIPDTVDVSASAEVIRSGLVEGFQDQTFDSLVPNEPLSDSWQTRIPRDGFTWHCFDLSDAPVIFTLRDTGTITYRLSGLDSQNMQILNTVDIVAQNNQSSDFAIFDVINEPGETLATWQPLAIDLVDDPNTASLLLNLPHQVVGQRLLSASNIFGVHPGSGLTLFDFAQDGTLTMREVPADSSLESYIKIQASSVAETHTLGVILSEEPYSTDDLFFAAWFTRDGESWQRVALPSTSSYDNAHLAYNAVRNQWLITSITDTDTTDVIHIGEEDAGWTIIGTESLSAPAEAFGTTVSGTPLLLSPPLSAQNTALQSADILALMDDQWQVINSLPPQRYFGRATTQDSIVFLTGEAVDNSYLVNAITLDLNNANLPLAHAALDELATYDTATLHAAGRSLLATLDETTLLYSINQGETWQSVSAPADSLEAYFLSGTLADMLIQAPGGFVFTLGKDDVEADVLLDMTSGEISLLPGNAQWAHYMTDGQRAYRLGLDSSLAEPELRAAVMSLPTVVEPETPDTGGRLSSKGGALYGLSLIPLALLAWRRRIA